MANVFLSFCLVGLRRHGRVASLLPPRFIHVDGHRGIAAVPYGHLRL